jgi:peptidoglycan/LPS O-acetylase OafA/YrhL
MNSPSHEKLLGIQFCRGVAAVLVVLYHAGRMLALPQYSGHIALGGFFNFGNAGVDFFFVLSGFIIFFVHEKDIGRPQSLPSYAWSRVTRIYPVYWLVTALVLASIATRSGVEALDPAYLISSLLLLPQPHEPVLSVGWTLVHEMLFYVVFAVAVLSRRFGLWVALGWLVLCATPAFFSFGDSVLGVVASPYHLQFALGVAAAYAVRHGPLRAASTLLCIGLAGFAGLAWAVDSNPDFYVSIACRCLLGLSCAAIIFGTARLELEGKLRVGRPAAFLGSASYSIYLIHAVVIGLFAKALMPTHLLTSLPSLSLLLVALLAVATGSILYLVAEQPMLRFAKSHRPGRSLAYRT